MPKYGLRDNEGSRMCVVVTVESGLMAWSTLLDEALGGACKNPTKG